MNDNTILVLTLSGICLALGAVLAFNGSQHSMSDKQATYCARVAAGDWPDFHHSYAAECEGAFGPQKPFIPYTERK